jgi:transposase
MRISWRTVGGIVERVAEEERILTKPLANLRRIGIDEVSYRKGHKYLTIVVDHDSGRVVWARRGRDEATVDAFLDELGEEGCQRIELVSADAAAWIRGPVRRRCGNATICMDPFHVIQWANEALDEVRRALWRDARAKGQRVLARLFKAGQFALRKRPENLTKHQQGRLADVAKTSVPLYRAYLLKELLREVFRLKGDKGGALLDEWLAWASRSRLHPFVELARKIRRHLEHIHAVLEHRLSNALVESCNTKVRVLTRMAFGFHSPEPLVGLIMLRLGRLCPPLPGRS